MESNDRTMDKIKVEKGSDNVFTDLGFPEETAKLMKLNHDLFLQFIDDHEKEKIKKEYYNQGLNKAVDIVTEIALDKSFNDLDGVRLALIKIAQIIKNKKMK